jgi:hypothetical protein
VPDIAMDTAQPVDKNLDASMPSPTPISIEGKRVKRRDLLNLFNYLNFSEGALFVRFRHRESGNYVYYQAYPLPCADETLSCKWLSPEPALARLKDYDCDTILVSDGASHLSIKAELLSLDAQSVSFHIPQSGYEKSIRAMDRQLCLGIEARIVQAGIGLSGRLEDFNALSFRVFIEEPSLPSLGWLNAELPVTLLLSGESGLLYSGECTVSRMSRTARECMLVLAPNFTSMRRYRARELRSKRQRLSPSAMARFRHPLTGAQVYLQVQNLSCMGLCVEEFFEHALLCPGLILPELKIEIANSFILACRCQVLYRNVVRNEDERCLVHCGIVFLDMTSKDQVQLSAIIHQSINDKLRVCASVDMDELWHFFFDSGFLYPSKYMSIEARKDEFKRTYRKLYLESPTIARHFFFQDKGKIFGHMSMLRFYANSWLIQHHAAARSGYGLAGVSVLDEMGRFVNDVRLHPSAHMKYLMCYYRRENRFPNRVFGNVAHDLADPKASSLDAFAYMQLPPEPALSPDAYQLFPARDEDLAELGRRYEEQSGGLMLDALDIRFADESDRGLSGEYAREGFKRLRQLFCLKAEGKLLAVLLLTISDLGLNLSNLTNCIHAIVLEPGQLKPSMLFSALHALRAHYLTDDPPVLIFPEDYLERYGMPCEKKYILWVLDSDNSDPYFDSVRNTFKRSCRDEEE